MSTTSASSIITYTKCPVCKGQNIKRVLAPIDYTVSQETFEVWHCEDCTLRFTQHIPNESEIGKYYQSEEYISHSNTSKGLINRLYQMVRDYTLIQKRKLIRKTSGKSTGQILDIGCGTGEFLGIMKKTGWKTLGLEPDPGAREQATQNHGISVYEPDHLFELEDGQYDVITMWHVLEHVHRLDAYMKKIRSLLTSDGVLIIAVPNYTSPDAGTYQETWAAYDVPRHLYHFSPASMQHLLTANAFRLEKMKMMPFDAFYVSLLSEKYRHGHTRLIQGFWHGFSSYLTSLFQTNRCSSVMYIIHPG